MEIDFTQILLQGGTSGVIALIVIVYLYLDSKKKNKDPMNGAGKAILFELQKQNGNHLSHIQSDITEGFRKLGDKQDSTNKLLYEIAGILKAQQK